MSAEKGSRVFDDKLDDVLAGRIAEKSNKNARRPASDEGEDVPSAGLKNSEEENYFAPFEPGESPTARPFFWRTKPFLFIAILGFAALMGGMVWWIIGRSKDD